MKRTYVVTGAASGIGAATAARIEADGGEVIRCDLHDADVVADLATPEGRRTFLAELERWDDINAVVAVAGGGLNVEVNYFGTVATLEGLRPRLATADAPRAVIVSSIASIRSYDEQLVELCLSGDEAAAVEAKNRLLPTDPALFDVTIYASAKSALNSWARRVAPTPEWAGAGIPLNVVAPAVVDTPGAAAILQTPAIREAVSGRLQMPLGGFPSPPEKMAAVLAWLAGPDNSLMTGQVLFVDGGAEAITRGERYW